MSSERLTGEIGYLGIVKPKLNHRIRSEGMENSGSSGECRMSAEAVLKERIERAETRIKYMKSLLIWLEEKKPDGEAEECLWSFIIGSSESYYH